MILSSKHIIRAARVFVILFLAANSGFTAVIRQCTMAPIQAMDCCAASSDRDGSPLKGSHSQGETAFTGVASDCHLSTVVGGLANVTALVEKDNSIRTASIVSPNPLLSDPTSFDSHSSQSVQFATPSLAFSPSSVEKCVLNSTFLI